MSSPVTHTLMVSPIETQSPSSLDSQKSLLMDGLTESGEAASHWLSNLRRSSCFLQLLNSSCLNFPGMAFQLLHYWSTNLNSFPPASQSDFLFSYLDIALARRDLLSWELPLKQTGFSQLVMQILHVSLTWCVETRVEEECGRGG